MAVQFGNATSFLRKQRTTFPLKFLLYRKVSAEMPLPVDRVPGPCESAVSPLCSATPQLLSPQAGRLSPTGSQSWEKLEIACEGSKGYRICLLSSMVTLSAWSLLKISKASWRPNDISSLIPVGDTGKGLSHSIRIPLIALSLYSDHKASPGSKRPTAERVQPVRWLQALPAGCQLGGGHSSDSDTRCTLWGCACTSM